MQNDTQPFVPISNDVVEGAKLPVFWGDPLLQGLHVVFFVAIGALVVYWLILNRTTLGYGVKAVGFNPEAARYGGINVPRNYFLAMAISGALRRAGGRRRRARAGSSGSRPATPGRDDRLRRHRGRTARPQHRRRCCTRRAAVRWRSHGHLDAQPRPRDLQPELASNLTLLIQGLVVLFVGADVIVLWLMARARRSKTA